jgi:iron complex transport system ATP-binding protein
MAKLIAYVPQQSTATRTMVFDEILLGRKPYIQWDMTNDDREIVSSLIRQLHLENISAKYLTELSGGELQKVVLARALAQQPQYLLLDEPTSNLDPRNQHDMLALVNEIAREKKIGVAIVIHDLNLAVRYCDQFLFLHDSVVYAHGDLSAVTPQAIWDVYHLDVDIIRHKGKTLIAPN